MTRRVGLRVKAFFGVNTQTERSNVVILDVPQQRTRESKAVPTRARAAQAATIVAGGVAASLAAEVAGRPIKACQKIMQQAPSPNVTAWRPNPVIHALRTQGLRPFLRPDQPQPSLASSTEKGRVMTRMVKRIGWRMVAVGPWGLGFLAWSFVSGEV